MIHLIHRRPRLVTPFRYSLIIAATACAYANASAAPVTWTPNASGLWTVAANWSSVSSLPGPADDVTINQPGPLTVTLSSGTQSINSLIDDNTLTLSAGTLAVAHALQINGTFNINGGILQNATLSTAGSGVIAFAGGTFDAVTVASNLSLGASASMSLTDGLTLSNSTVSLINGSVLFFSGNQTISGTGVIEFDGAGFISQSGTVTATIGPNVTIQTGTASGPILTAGLINHGTLSAQGGKTLTITSASLTNTGTLQAGTGGTIIIQSSLTTTQLGAFNSTGGTIQLSGTLDNTASTLALNGAANSLLLAGTIKNGTVSTANGAALTIAGGTLDGVTLASNLPIGAGASVTLKDGLTLSNSNISLINGSVLSFSGNQTVGGTGVIEFDGAGFISQSGNATVTTGANITIQTGTASGSILTAGLINQGTLSAQGTGKTLTISSATSLTNTGTLQAGNGGTINILGNITPSGLGTFNSTGGTIQISGTLDNTSSVIALNGAANSLLLSGTIKSGTVSTANGAALTIAGGTLDGVTLASNLPIGAGASVTLKDDLTLSNSNITLITGSVLSFSGNQTLGGTGVIQFDGAASISQSGTTTLTVGPNITIQTGASSGSILTAGLINQGTLSSQISGKILTIGNTTSLTNTGTLRAGSGGTINIQGAITPSGLGAFNSTGGTIQISGTLDNTASTLALNGAGNSLLLTGAINGGNISIAGGAQLSMTAGTFNVANLTIGAGGNLQQSAGNVTLASLSQSGGSISLGGIAQTLYAVPTITITAGTTTLTKDALKVLTTASLTFGGSPGAWTGDLDLTQNKLIVESTILTKPAMLAALRDQAFFGRTNAAGITSSTSAANFAVAVLDNAVLGNATFGNQTVDSNAILVAPEILGDANADGHVDLTDLSTILNNFGSSTPAWTSGNFDNAPTIDLTDLSDVLNNFGQSNPNATISAFSLQPSAFSIPTPEPTSLLLLALGTTAFLRKPRQRN